MLECHCGRADLRRQLQLPEACPRWTEAPGQMVVAAGVAASLVEAAHLDRAVRASAPLAGVAYPVLAAPATCLAWKERPALVVRPVLGLEARAIAPLRRFRPTPGTAAHAVTIARAERAKEAPAGLQTSGDPAGSSTISKCTLPLCAQSVPIAQDSAVVRDIVGDEQAVYWLSGPNVEDATGAVMRLAH